MARFSVRKLHFGQRTKDDSDDIGEGLPTPARIKLAAQSRRRYRRSQQCAGTPTGTRRKPALHLHGSGWICPTLLNRWVSGSARVDRLMIATLGYNERNLAAMLAWLDAGAVSRWRWSHRSFSARTKATYGPRRCKSFAHEDSTACCDSHAKVVTMAFASGERLAIEGSANLCGNGSGREQFALINDPYLHDWHAAWIDQLVTKHEGDESNNPAAALKKSYASGLTAQEFWDVREYVRKKSRKRVPPGCWPRAASLSATARYGDTSVRSDQLIAESCRSSRKKLLRRHLAQRRNLYAKAVSSGDYRTALAALRDEAELLSLYPPKKVAPTDPTGTKQYASQSSAERHADLMAILDRVRARGGSGDLESTAGESEGGT